MSQENTSLATVVVQPPWRQSTKGAVYCMWGSLLEDIKSLLKQEDKFEITSGDFHYSVRQNQDGGYIVFRNTKAEYETRSKQ